MPPLNELSAECLLQPKGALDSIDGVGAGLGEVYDGRDQGSVLPHPRSDQFLLVCAGRGSLNPAHDCLPGADRTPEAPRAE